MLEVDYLSHQLHSLPWRYLKVGDGSLVGHALSPLGIPVSRGLLIQCCISLDLPRSCWLDFIRHTVSVARLAERGIMDLILAGQNHKFCLWPHYSRMVDL